MNMMMIYIYMKIHKDIVGFNKCFHRYVKKDARVSLAGTDLVVANITQEVIVNCHDHRKHHNICRHLRHDYDW